MASADLTSMITATLVGSTLPISANTGLHAFSGGADATDDADGDGVVTTFTVTETASSTATDIATITVTDPDDTYAVSDFTVSDDRLELIASTTANIFTLRIRKGALFNFDETPGADNTFTVTVTGLTALPPALPARSLMTRRLIRQIARRQ